jgi:pimeloyl-ACP methyl ester carboxylesterase
MEFEHKIVKTEIGDVEYTDIGSGPVIVLSHGTPGGSDVGPLIFSEIISHDFRLITPSRPGYLKTSLDLGKTPEEQAKVFYHFIEALNIEKASFLAWSGGGPLALNFAINYPEKISSLVMLSTVTKKLVEKSMLFKLFVKNEFLPRTLLSAKKSLPFLNNLICKELGANPKIALSDEKKLKILDALIASTMPSNLRFHGYANDAEQFAKLEDMEFHKVLCPTMILFDEKDTQVHVHHGDHLSEKIPHSVYLKFTKGGHTPMLDEESIVVIEHMVKFFKEHV